MKFHKKMYVLKWQPKPGSEDSLIKDWYILDNARQHNMVTTSILSATKYYTKKEARAYAKKYGNCMIKPVWWKRSEPNELYPTGVDVWM